MRCSEAGGRHRPTLRHQAHRALHLRSSPAPWLVTAPHVYVRGHGPRGTYEGEYPERRLRAWADTRRAWCDEGRTVYVYFDNDQKSVAPFDALKLRRRLAAR